MSDDEQVDQNEMADEWAAAMEQQGDGDAIGDEWGAALEEQAAVEGEQAVRAELEDLNSSLATTDPDVKLDVILDIPLTIAMEIGRAKISVRNLLQLNQGSIVELDRLAGESLDVLVNGTLIAHGEVVVVNDKFGIRLTDVISPVERIKNLK